MAKQRRVANKEEVLAALIEEQKRITNIREWRQAEALWLREKLHMSGLQVAEALNYRLQTVYLLWHRWMKEGLAIFVNKKPPGGRNNAYMTVEEEEEFLRPFREKTPQGGIVEIGEIKEAFEARIGATIPKSTIYRLLKRHGWRKVSPGKKHPKSDPVLQEELKKTHR
jgi:transposase